MLTGDFPVYLDVRAQTLKTVRVGEFSNYQLDSMDRRREYDSAPYFSYGYAVAQRNGARGRWEPWYWRWRDQ